ncbi:MAG: putative sugar O-methyltransferase [Nitrospira sp.]|jgi:hypothetical protein|nr:putative sugar O-methyltransferase [Nitrospira sp.]
MYCDIVSNTLESFHRYLSRNETYCRNHPAARVSAFWNAHFNDRNNFPNIQQFMTFRRSDFLYGIGDTRPSTLEQKQREFDHTLKSTSLFVPGDFLRRLPEPTFGAPHVFPRDSICQSASFVLNAGTTWRVSRLINRYGLTDRPLHIAEIGAGWGACAYQLHHAAAVSSYTVIDLPENLCLSSVYLASTLPSRKVLFIECASGNQATPLSNHLHFALPPAIDSLFGPYDVLLNTLSFQEMDRETVKEYFDFAHRTLSSDGILVSFNSHGKAGIRRPSEYLTPGLQLVHMQPFRKVPAGFFNTIPYEMVFRKTDHQPSKLELIAVDAIGEMMQFGLDQDLIEPIHQLTSGTLSHALQAELTHIHDFFYAIEENRREQLAHLLLSTHRSARTLFLVANYRFANGEFETASRLVEESLEQGLRDFAAVRAHILLALSRPSTAADTMDALAFTSAGLFDEIAGILEQRTVSALQNHIARVLNCSVGRTFGLQEILRRLRKKPHNRPPVTP